MFVFESVSTLSFLSCLLVLFLCVLFFFCTIEAERVGGGSGGSVVMVLVVKFSSLCGYFVPGQLCDFVMSTGGRDQLEGFNKQCPLKSTETI